MFIKTSEVKRQDDFVVSENIAITDKEMYLNYIQHFIDWFKYVSNFRIKDMKVLINNVESVVKYEVPKELKDWEYDILSVADSRQRWEKHKSVTFKLPFYLMPMFLKKEVEDKVRELRDRNAMKDLTSNLDIYSVFSIEVLDKGVRNSFEVTLTFSSEVIYNEIISRYDDVSDLLSSLKDAKGKVLIDDEEMKVCSRFKDAYLSKIE